MPSNKRDFETARTRKFRESQLSAQDERTITHIEEFGCSVVNVARTDYGLGWSYTIGIFDTCGKPEIITVGLPSEAAHFALNEAAKLLRAGADLTKGRRGDLVGQVECEFRPVDPKWVAQLMGWAIWYYGGTDFPMLQAVYPDLENRFPEDKEFDKTFEQPLMQPAAPMTRVGSDSWASTDPKSSLFNWKFPDLPHTGVFLSQAVHKGPSRSHTSHTMLKMELPLYGWVALGGGARCCTLDVLRACKGTDYAGSNAGAGYGRAGSRGLRTNREPGA
jgi:hypothetical protein